MGVYKRALQTGGVLGVEHSTSTPTERYGLGLRLSMWPLRPDVLNRLFGLSEADQLVWVGWDKDEVLKWVNSRPRGLSGAPPQLQGEAAKAAH